MATEPEKGVSENPTWARETEEYLLRLPPVSRAKWLDPFRTQIRQWDKFQDKIRELLKGRWSDSFPWVWEMERLVPDRCVIMERTFDSIDGFMDCLQMRGVEPSRTRIILVCSEYERTKGLIPKAGIAKFDWCTSVVTLALLGSQWKIAPETLFPMIRYWNDLWSDDTEPGPKLLGGEQNVDSLDSLRLPSKRPVTSPVSMNYGQIVTETLFFAITFIPPQLDKDFLNTFKFHYDKPDYHFLRLIRVSRAIDINQAFDMYIVKYIGRKDPSYNKVNYVLHLRDHLEMMKRFLDYLAREFPGLPDFKPLDQTDIWPSAFKGDQDYLRSVIVSLEKEVEQVYETIKTQIENKNSSRNILFAVLASLYLPFSLATGVFGMNIREINNGAPRWSAVVALGLPLAVVTVAMPLGFNFGYRKVTEFITKNPKSFRILLSSIIFLSIAVTIVIVIVVLLTTKKK
ncbi:MAG: hypothetical protein LQ351_008160 [Letrouitia transgressa]|nr:MAG: hypothetical protein LQ351_008160 [Letrouitia transgressa]